jgi:hypothetical protein
MNLFQKFTARQLGRNYIDRTRRGHGNQAARRAIRTALGREHLQFESEEIYTDRPAILRNGALLLVISKYPHIRPSAARELHTF